MEQRLPNLTSDKVGLFYAFRFGRNQAIINKRQDGRRIPCRRIKNGNNN